MSEHLEKPSIPDAQALNDLLRAPAHPGVESDSSAAPIRSELQDNAQFAYTHWDLGDKPAVQGRLATVPLIGGLLAFGRELYGSLWLKANRRSPFAQQVDLNKAMARAIRALTWYIDDRDQIWIRLDRDVQVVRSGVGMIDSDLLRMQQQVNELQARIAALEAGATPNPAASPSATHGSSRAQP